MKDLIVEGSTASVTPDVANCEDVRECPDSTESPTASQVPRFAQPFAVSTQSSMTRDDVIRSTAGHIRRVGELLVDVAHRLSFRAVIHDASKWSPQEWPAFEEATPKLADLEYGSEGYKASLRAIKPAIDHHQGANSHHPEFYWNGISGMTLLDLMEMLCDWKAAGERHKTGNIVASLKHNRERFGISDQLFEILTNTAVEMQWITTNLVTPEGAALAEVMDPSPDSQAVTITETSAVVGMNKKSDPEANQEDSVNNTSLGDN